MEKMINCRYFSGYKPCGLSDECSSKCTHYDEVTSQILVIHLGALGAVLRSTSLLKPIKRKFPKSELTWVTSKSATPLLENNPLVDRILDYSFDGWNEAKGKSYDAVFCIDKDLKATSLLKEVDYELLFGFTNDENGKILPANVEAQELWEIGLDDNRKFFENQKTENRLITEALNLNYEKDPYLLSLTSEESAEITRRREFFLGDAKGLIGINVGCASTIPYKKLSVPNHIDLINLIRKSFPDYEVVLLGGKEDELRARSISEHTEVQLSNMHRGLRDGLLSVAACDVIVSGDSLGMHMGIGLKKWVVAWFGPTCSHEVELYGRGVKVLSQAGCGPCWKRQCSNELMCYDLVDFKQILSGIKKGFLEFDDDVGLPPAL